MKKWLFGVLGVGVAVAVSVPAVAQGLVPAGEVGAMVNRSLVQATMAQRRLVNASQNVYRAVLSGKGLEAPISAIVARKGGSLTAALPLSFRPRLSLTPEQARSVLEGTLTLSSPQEQADFYLYDLPRLMVEEPSASYAEILPEATAYYRSVLAEPITDESVDAWALRMSAMTGLSMTGSEADIPLFLNVAQKLPLTYKKWTDQYTAAHLMSFGEPGYKAVTDLYTFRLAQGGELPGWGDISKHMQRVGHPLYIPDSRVPDNSGPIISWALRDNVQAALIRSNALNYALSLTCARGAFEAYGSMLQAAREFSSLHQTGLQLTAHSGPLNRGIQAPRRFPAIDASTITFTPAGGLELTAGNMGIQTAAFGAPVAVAEDSYQVTVPGTDRVLTAPGAQTAEEAQEMGAVLQHIRDRIQIAQRLLANEEKELAKLQRRQKWLPFGRDMREMYIGSYQWGSNFYTEEIEGLQELLARATASIEEGQSLAQVRNMAYDVKKEAQYYVVVPGGSGVEYIAAPGAKTPWEAWKMQEYALIAYDRFSSENASSLKSAIENGRSLYDIGHRVNPRTVNAYGINAPQEGPLFVADPATIYFHKSYTVREREKWNKEHAGLLQPWEFLKIEYGPDDYFHIESIPALGATTVAEVEQMQTLLVQAWDWMENTKDAVLKASRERGYGYMRGAIENGEPLSAVRRIYEMYFSR